MSYAWERYVFYRTIFNRIICGCMPMAGQIKKTDRNYEDAVSIKFSAGLLHANKLLNSTVMLAYE